MRGATGYPDLFPQFARQPKAKLMPKPMIDLMWLLNTHTCREHGQVCRRTHLQENHGLGVPVSEWLVRYQGNGRTDRAVQEDVDRQILQIISQVGSL